MRRLHIFILFQLAVFQPLFEQLRLSPEFFLANNNSPIDIIVLFLLFWLVFPLLLIAAAQILANLFPKIAKPLHLALFALLFVVTICFALNRTSDLPPFVMVAIACCVTAALTAGYIRYTSIRSFFTLLFPIVLIPPVLFFSHPFILKLLRPESAVPKNVQMTNPSPVVFIIFDELPLSSLLNARDEIDSIRFPHFAAFSKQSHWFRNTTTVAGFTSTAVPALLSGRYPSGSRLPMFFDHPENIFVMLGSTHRIVARETATRLCPGSLCDNITDPFRVRLQTLLSHVLILYTHVVLPPAWADRWFPIEDVVNFCKSAEDRAADFQQFLQHIEPAGKARPPFYFLHTQLPHSPWRYHPSGSTMSEETLQAIKQKIAQRAPDRAAELFMLECHLLQVGFVDRLLGQFIDKLKQANLYDDSVIVITSDHGMIRGFEDSGPPIAAAKLSQAAGTEARAPDGGAAGTKVRAPDGLVTHSPENMLVPFFVKLPHQTEPVVSDRNVETIDVVATIADALGGPVNWSDGQSALNESVPERPDKFFYDHGVRVRLNPHASIDRKMLANKLELDQFQIVLTPGR